MSNRQTNQRTANQPGIQLSLIPKPKPLWNPEPPTGANHPRTSLEAAERIKPITGKQQIIVYEFILSRGEHGATDEEILDGTSLGPNSVRGRRGALACDDRIIKTDFTRKTKSGNDATVWRVV